MLALERGRVREIVQRVVSDRFERDEILEALGERVPMSNAYVLVSNLADTASRVIEHMLDVDPSVSALWPELREIRRRLVEIETEARDRAGAEATDKRHALSELADDLRRWEKACRDQYGPIQDLVLATVLARVAANCEQLVVALTGKVTIDGIEHSCPDVIEKLEGR